MHWMMKMKKNTDLQEVRCKECNKLLAKERIIGVLEIKCTRCNTLNVINK